MNTYNENLQQTVVNTLSALALNQSNLDSLKTVAEYTLYYAQGAEITARDKLEGTEDDVTTWQNINNQSLINANQVFNLLTSTTESNTDVAVSITNTATAAANVQIASNAISVLASDIGAAFNIATAALYQTDVYEKIQSANSLINEVANEAKRISKSAMNASGSTSEITISEVLAQTTGVKSKIDNLFTSTQAELDKFAKLAITENAQITKASKAERQAEGELADARREVTAINTAYDNSNNQLNQCLSISVVSQSKITASFAALPLPTFYSPQASIVKIPLANPTYYLTLVPAQNQTTFSIDQVEQLFSQRPENDKSLFVYITPDASIDATGAVTRSPTCIQLSSDAFGNPVQAGSSYVAFLYIELSKEYKQYISNYSELLSAPSQPFTPATTLPLAQNLVVTPNKTPDATGVTWSTASLTFTPLVSSADTATEQTDATAVSPTKGKTKSVAAQADAAATVQQPAATSAATAVAQVAGSSTAILAYEFRCILVEQGGTPDLNLLRCPENLNLPPIYFNQAIAGQVSPANYIAVSAASGDCELRFLPSTTDNFGNEIKPNTMYQPYVLTVATGDPSDQAQYANVLANTLPAITVCTQA